MSLKTIKNKIRSIDKTRQVTKALEAVSAVKMRKSQSRALLARPYALNALTILRELSVSVDVLSHPLSKKRPVQNVCMIVVTSDRGLAGSLNALVLKACEQKINSLGVEKKHIGIISVGRRGGSYFSRRGYAIIDSYEGWGDSINFDDVEPLISRVKALFEDGTFDEVFIAYTNFISTLKQKPIIHKVLPIKREDVADIVRGIVPESGRYSEKKATEDNTSGRPKHYIFEPNPEAVLQRVIPLLLKIQIYHAALEANASEHSARMVAMKNASDNASEIVARLQRTYNKVRQASITREVSEIVGGMEAQQ